MQFDFPLWADPTSLHKCVGLRSTLRIGDFCNGDPNKNQRHHPKKQTTHRLEIKCPKQQPHQDPTPGFHRQDFALSPALFTPSPLGSKAGPIHFYLRRGVDVQDLEVPTASLVGSAWQFQLRKKLWSIREPSLKWLSKNYQLFWHMPKHWGEQKMSQSTNCSNK